MTNVKDEEFNFAWTKNKDNNKGKVFKKKGNATKTTTTITNKVNVKKKVQKPMEKTLESKSLHIKRKHKKDKQLRLTESSNATEKNDNNKKNVNKNYSLFGERPKELYVNTEIGKSVQEDLFTKSGKSFKDLDVHRHLISNLEKINYTKLTNVQEKSIPVIMSGRNTLVSNCKFKSLWLHIRLCIR